MSRVLAETELEKLIRTRGIIKMPQTPDARGKDDINAVSATHEWSRRRVVMQAALIRLGSGANLSGVKYVRARLTQEVLVNLISGFSGMSVHHRCLHLRDLCHD